jgi:hypothetical protein
MEWKAMCDDTFQCLRYLVAFLIMLVVPPLLICWIWCALLR